MASNDKVRQSQNLICQTCGGGGIITHMQWYFMGKKMFIGISSDYQRQFLFLFCL